MENSKEIEKIFLEYTEKFDKNNPKINRKIYHSIRVSNNCKKIAESLNLSEKEIYVAEVIGILHDLGKLEQIADEKYKTIEHGKLGVEILKKDKYIREYIKTEEYDNIIFKAIENHGLFSIEQNLNEQELLFAKIIRDADKLDIFYEAAEMFWNTEAEKKEIGESEIDQNYLQKIRENKVINKGTQKKKEASINGVISVISYIFDINFSYTLAVLKKENYVEKILNKFIFTNVQTKEQIEEIKQIIEKINL